MIQILCLLWAIISYSKAEYLTLEEAFRASKDNMESIKRAEVLIRQSTERKKQAQGSLMPSVRFVGTETRIDSPKPGLVNRAFVLTRQYSTALRLEQPLLRGGSIAALELTDEEILLNKFFKEFELLSLYQIVVKNYYDYLRALKDLELLNELLFLSEKREKELLYLTKLGRSRKSELIQAEAQSLGVKAKIHDANIFLNQSRENLKFLSNLNIDQVPSLNDLSHEVSDLDLLHSRISLRPDILAKDQELKMAEKQISIAKGGHYPSVDFFSNYYIDRTGILQTSEWDFGVSISFPLFQGGVVQSNVRETLELKRGVELSRLELKRTLSKEVTILHQNYQELIDQLKLMKLAVKKSQEAYELNLKDYKLGQITNLEVLQSLNLYIENKRIHQGLLAEAHAHLKNLQAFSGDLP